MLLIVIYPLRVSFICCQIGDNSVNNKDVARRLFKSRHNMIEGRSMGVNC